MVHTTTTCKLHIWPALRDGQQFKSNQIYLPAHVQETMHNVKPLRISRGLMLVQYHCLWVLLVYLAVCVMLCLSHSWLLILCKRCTRLPRCVRLRNDLYCVGWGVKLYSFTQRPLTVVPAKRRLISCSIFW